MISRILSTFVFVAVVRVPASPQELKQAPAEVYDTYNAVLAGMKFPVADPHIGIADTTLNTGCGEASRNPVLMNNCGMFIPPATADGIYAEAREAWPALSGEAWTDLVQRSRTSAHLNDSFVTPFQHRLSDLKSTGKGPWESPNAWLFFSNVGFNKKHNQALLYIQVFSYTPRVPTGGDLFLLKLAPSGKWQVDGRLTLIQIATDTAKGTQS